MYFPTEFKLSPSEANQGDVSQTTAALVCALLLYLTLTATAGTLLICKVLKHDMKVRIVFRACRPVGLPWHYPKRLQGFAYRMIEKCSPELATRLPSEGFIPRSHRYKLMSFSWLYLKSATRKGKGLFMETPINWWRSSPFKPLSPIVASSVAVRVCNCKPSQQRGGGKKLSERPVSEKGAFKNSE